MKEYEFCLRCHRRLKTEQAKQLGYGKICYEKAKATNRGTYKLFPLSQTTVPVENTYNM